MKALVLKEFKSVFCSSVGAFFALAFFLASALMLWVFSGSYNIIDGGYADLSRFFSLAPILFIVLIPALTMRLYAEEKRNKTMDILISRPLHALNIYLSKFFATFVFVLVTLCCTCIYILLIYLLANPVGNIDNGSIFASYLSLLFLITIFISIGLFSSSITKNQIVAFVLSVSLCLFIFYGLDLLASLSISGKTKGFISSLGLNYHYESMQRGVLQLSDIRVFTNWLLIFALSTLLMTNIKLRIAYLYIPTTIILNIFFKLSPDFRLDFTADKRYTLSEYTIDILKRSNTSQVLKVNIYLTGDLNYGFEHLRNETDKLLKDISRYTNGTIFTTHIYPYQKNENPNQIYQEMANKRMPGIRLNETDREGKISQKIIYPYASITNNKDTLIIPLLKNIPGNSADENLNASIENLEYEFIDAIRLLSQNKPKSIAFIEGHKELSRSSIYDAEELLSKYYFVNRGEIGLDINILNDFDAIIIAGPLLKYTNEEKYILDQYIMRGGKVLWLVDGAFYSHEELASLGYSASMKNDVNVDDMLFTYGVRINPDLIQDKQCVSTYLITDESQTSTLVPSYFQPLLIPSADFSVTKNIRDVKAGFASSIDIVNNSADIKKNVLLTSSGNTHLLKVPETINFEISEIQNQPEYFNQAYLPVAVSLEGKFNSSFANRPIPNGVIDQHKTIEQSKATKMIVVSSSDIITNEYQGQGDNTQVLPMGYDRASNQLFGNREFIINAVNWLTDDEGLMQLRNKQQRMFLLDKAKAYENRNRYAIFSIAFPIMIMALIMGSVIIYRKRKYESDIKK